MEVAKGYKVILLAFLATLGFTFLIIGCALPIFNNYWLLFLLAFYCLSTVIIYILRRHQTNDENSILVDISMFFLTIMAVSCFCFPLLLVRVSVIKIGACLFSWAANIVIFITMQLTFKINSDMDEALL